MLCVPLGRWRTHAFIAPVSTERICVISGDERLSESETGKLLCSCFRQSRNYSALFSCVTGDESGRRPVPGSARPVYVSPPHQASSVRNDVEIKARAERVIASSRAAEPPHRDELPVGVCNPTVGCAALGGLAVGGRAGCSDDAATVRRVSVCGHGGLRPSLALVCLE